MQWSDIPLHPAPRLLRQFAGLWLLFFAAWACWLWWMRDNPSAALWLLGIGVLVGGAGLVRPRLVRPIFVGWMCLAFPIGWVVSHVVLAVLFYGLFTPIALAFRLVGRDALALRRPSGQDSYWLAKPPPADVRSYYRQA